MRQPNDRRQPSGLATSPDVLESYREVKREKRAASVLHSMRTLMRASKPIPLLLILVGTWVWYLVTRSGLSLTAVLIATAGVIFYLILMSVTVHRDREAEKERQRKEAERLALIDQLSERDMMRRQQEGRIYRHRPAQRIHIHESVTPTTEEPRPYLDDAAVDFHRRLRKDDDEERQRRRRNETDDVGFSAQYVTLPQHTSVPDTECRSSSYDSPTDSGGGDSSGGCSGGD